MQYTNFSGKTVEDAITNASIALGITSDQITYEVVEKGSAGFLGLGSKDAVIRVALGEKETAPAKEAVKEEAPVAEAAPAAETAEAEEAPAEEVEEAPAAEAAPEKSKKAEKTNTPEAIDAAAEAAGEFLADMFAAMNMDVTIDCEYDEEENSMNIDLSGPQMGVIIGKRGQTLDAVQYLTSLVANRRLDGYVRVKVDTENYRQRREETLENLARNMAAKAKRTGRSVDLEPMNPYERRIIHTALQADSAVETHSEGEEPYRYVVITLK